MRLAATAIGVLLVTTALPATAGAQAAPDARWGPWLGCWELVQLPERSDPREGVVEDEAVPAVTSDARVCVERAPDGVMVRTLVDGAPVLEQTMVADGTARAIEREGCTGTERAWWSSTGIRLFSEARLTCSGGERRVSGMAFIGADGRWMDVQSVQVASADTVRVRQFEPDAAKAAVPNVAAAALTIADVVEASEQVAPSTLEAAILESRSRFPISAQVLVDLSDAGVPGSVTDLMVAVTFPEQFRIARAVPDDRVAYADPYPYYRGIGRWSWGWSDPYLYSPYFYSPFGYSYLGYYPSTVIITGGGGGGVFVPGDGGQASGPGRVVNGRGYTRVESRGPEAPASGRSGGSVSPQGFTSGASSGGSSSGGGTSTSSGGDSGGGGGSSSGGGSSGGGGSSSGGGDSGGGGRTAVPR